jgi:hypothetical protein
MAKAEMELRRTSALDELAEDMHTRPERLTLHHPLRRARSVGRRLRGRERNELAVPMRTATVAFDPPAARAPSTATERPGGLEVDDQFVLGRRLDWQVGWLLALEDAIDILATQ